MLLPVKYHIIEAIHTIDYVLSLYIVNVNKHQDSRDLIGSMEVGGRG